MSYQKAKEFLESKNLAQHIIRLDEKSGTVEEAANALGVTEAEIAKTLSFIVDENPILIVLEGTAKIDNKKYRHTFHTKAKMIPFESVEPIVGHGVGGVCPFGVNEGIKIFFDESLRKFEKVYPAVGDDHTAAELSVAEMEAAVQPAAWVDVAKII